MRVQVEVYVEFGQPIQLTEITRHRQALLVRGIYVLNEGKPRGKVFDTVAKRIVCIGKAIGETIFSRCQKHMWSVQDARLSNGNPRTTPGHSFRRYRETINFDASVLWLTPGVMCAEKPWAISCAEEYLLYQYKEKHGRFPECNSAGQKRQAEPGAAPDRGGTNRFQGSISLRRRGR